MMVLCCAGMLVLSLYAMSTPEPERPADPALFAGAFCLCTALTILAWAKYWH
jgi:hypothetical protein